MSPRCLVSTCRRPSRGPWFSIFLTTFFEAHAARSFPLRPPFPLVACSLPFFLLCMGFSPNFSLFSPSALSLSRFSSPLLSFSDSLSVCLFLPAHPKNRDIFDREKRTKKARIRYTREGRFHDAYKRAARGRSGTGATEGARGRIVSERSEGKTAHLRIHARRKRLEGGQRRFSEKK